MRLSRDGLLGLVCLGVSVLLFVQSLSLPHLPIVPVGPGFYPRLVLGFMAIVSAVLVVQDWMANARADRQAEEAPSEDVRDYRLVAAAFAAVAAYVAALPVLGFRISTVLFLVGLQVILERPATAGAWLRVVLLAVGTSAVCYLLFETYLSVLLPRGSWTGW